MTTATAPAPSAFASEKSTSSSVPKSTKEDASPLNVPVRNTSLTGAVFNLTKSAVGAGTVFLPALLKTLGPVAGTTYLIVAGALCALPLYFLGRMAHHCETGDYFKLGRLALGKKGETAVSISLLLFLAGGLIAYAYCVGDFLSSSLISLVGAEKLPAFLANKGNMSVIMAIAAIFPLSCLRDMSKLAFTSIIGMVCMLGIAGMLTYDAIFTIGGDKALPFGDVKTAVSIGTYLSLLASSAGAVIFAYVNHFTIVSLVPVMVDPSAKSRMKLIGASSGLAVMVYLMAAVGGYMRFGSACTDNILNVYDSQPYTPIIYTIAKLSLALVLVCSYPLLCDPARSCLDSLAFGPNSRLSKGFRHYLETALIVAVPVTVAYLTEDKSLGVLNVFAGLCGSLLVFSMPGLFYLRLSRSFKFSITRLERGLSYFCIGFGLILAVSSTIFNVMKLVSTPAKAA